MDHINYMITLTVITLREFHCTCLSITSVRQFRPKIYFSKRIIYSQVQTKNLLFKTNCFFSGSNIKITFQNVLRYAVDRVNGNEEILPQTRLTAQIERIPPHDSFYASKQVVILNKIRSILEQDQKSGLRIGIRDQRFRLRTEIRHPNASFHGLKQVVIKQISNQTR